MGQQIWFFQSELTHGHVASHLQNEEMRIPFLNTSGL